MKTCQKCGAQVADEAKICPSCGAEIGAAAGGADQFQQNAQNYVNGLDRTSEYDAADINETKAICIVSYLSILFFLPLVIYPNSKVGRFHANQALLMLIISAILSIVTSVLSAFAFMPGLGWTFIVLTSVLGSITGLVFLAAFIFELVNILNNKVVELPLIGKIKIIK